MIDHDQEQDHDYDELAKAGAPNMLDIISQPWPWYVAGPILGSMVPLMFYIANKTFGISSTLRHVCAAVTPVKVPFLDYKWKDELWSILFAIGILIGGFIGSHFLSQPGQTSISPQTFEILSSLGVEDTKGLVPSDVFSWKNLLTVQGFCFMIIGGFLVGFGTRYAGGCTSGHGLTGTALLQPASFVALIAFFAGGLFSTHLLIPLLLNR